MIRLVEFLDEVMDFEGVKLRRIRENLTDIFVPDPFFYKKGRTDYLPASLPVWYNPRMEFNRDLTLLALSVYVKHFRYDSDEVTYVEALGGTGIRGFRVFVEIVKKRGFSVRVILNDVNPLACKLIEFNKKFFEFPDLIEVYCLDANYLFHHLKKSKGYSLDVIELDPYGSPMPFVPSTAQVLRGRGGLSIMTATDLAPLHGKYPRSGLRKYGVWLVRNKFEAETATRALIYAVGREFSIYSKAFKPVFSIAYDGFIKIAGIVDKGKIKANSFWDKVVFLRYDPENPYMSSFVTLEDIPKGDSGKVRYIGPLWGGGIGDEDFCYLMLNEIKEIPLSNSSKRRLERFLKWLIDGSDIPLYVDLNDFGKFASGQTPPVDDVVKALKNKGIISSRTFFNFNAIKMDLTQENLNELIEVISRLGEQRAAKRP